MRRTLPLIALAVLVAVPAMSGKKTPPAPEAPAATPAAAAVANPDAVVKYRHTVMEGMAKHMKGSAMIVKGEVDRPQDMLMHATALHHASQAIPTLFPAGTDPASIKSDSKPEVWSQWEDFLAKNKAFEEASAKLVEAAQAGDAAAFKDAFGAVGQSCGGCHDTYRVDED